MRHSITVALFVSSCITATAHAQNSPVRVFVTSAGAANGLTDPSKDNQDSVSDLRNSLHGKKRITLVDSADEASIVLTVLGRGKSDFTAGLFGPARDVALRVMLRFNGAESELSASAMGGTMMSGGAWKKAAGKIADQVDTWIKANAQTAAAK